MKRILAFSLVLIVSMLSIANATDGPPRENPDNKTNGTLPPYEACHAKTTGLVLGAGSLITQELYGNAGTVMGWVGLYFSNIEGMGKCICKTRPVRTCCGYIPMTVCTVVTEHLCGDFWLGEGCCWAPERTIGSN
jgi:hypothetical protein